MIILGLDCTLDNCAIAISRNGQELAQRNHASKNNHAEILPNMVFEIKNHSIGVKESDCPDKICMRSGFMKESGSSAVCIPNKAILRICTPEV